MTPQASCKYNGHGFNDDGVCIYCHEDDGTQTKASDTPPSDDALREALWDEVADRFNRQPRPNDYADDAAYDEAAAEFIDDFVNYVTTHTAQAVREAEERAEAIAYDVAYKTAINDLTMNTTLTNPNPKEES